MGPFWSSSIWVVFHLGRLPFWSSSLLVVFHFCRLPFWSSSFFVVFHFGRLPFWSSSILVVFHFGCDPIEINLLVPFASKVLYRLSCNNIVGVGWAVTIAIVVS